jgi:nucleoside-diphosphate-sugar epimerase
MQVSWSPALQHLSLSGCVGGEDPSVTALVVLSSAELSSRGIRPDEGSPQMRLTITGGSGQVGTAISAAMLNRGHEVVVLDRRPPTVRISNAVIYRSVDFTNFAAVSTELRDCEAVIHLAGIPNPRESDEVAVHDNNVVSSYHVLAAAAQIGIRRVVQASSINAIGATWSRSPRFDYFPIDERHPTYNEDGYSLSKWIAEAQAASLTRRYVGLSVASLRFHAFVPNRQAAIDWSIKEGEDWTARGLWGYTTTTMLADACLLASEADFTGHESFFIVASDTVADVTSAELHKRWYPEVPTLRPLIGREGFYNCDHASRVLGWGTGRD